MTSNHVKRLYGDDGLGFGLGFEVTEQVGAAGRYDTVGSYGWGSAYYSKYWVDPSEKLVAVFMTQLIPATGVDLAGQVPDAGVSGDCRAGAGTGGSGHCSGKPRRALARNRRSAVPVLR